MSIWYAPSPRASPQWKKPDLKVKKAFTRFPRALPRPVGFADEGRTMRKLTGLIASAAVLVPATALAQTAMPPTPWEDVPPAALHAPGQPVQSTAPTPSAVPVPTPAPHPGVSWQHGPATPPPPPPADMHVHRDGPAEVHVEFREAPSPAYGRDLDDEDYTFHADDYDEDFDARVHADRRHRDPHFDHEGCRALPGHRYECSGQGYGYGYAYPQGYGYYGYGYPGYGYGGTVTITETTVTTGPGVTVRTYQDEAQAPHRHRVRRHMHKPEVRPAPPPAGEKG